MASLKLVTEKRNALFFGKYLYRAKCKVHGAVYTYYTKNIDQFRAKMAKRLDEPPPPYVAIYDIDHKRRIELIDYDQIARYFEWRNHVDSDTYTVRIQGNTISFFSDDIRLLQTLTVLDENLEISIAELTGNVMYFKNTPKYKYRTYFRGKKVPDNFKEEVRSFIERYKNIAHICPALRRLIDNVKGTRYWYNYLHSSYYVEYNDESTSTLLHMFFGSMLGKTFTLEKEP